MRARSKRKKKSLALVLGGRKSIRSKQKLSRTGPCPPSELRHANTSLLLDVGKALVQISQAHWATP